MVSLQMFNFLKPFITFCLFIWRNFPIFTLVFEKNIYNIFKIINYIKQYFNSYSSFFYKSTPLMLQYTIILFYFIKYIKQSYTTYSFNV